MNQANLTTTVRKPKPEHRHHRYSRGCDRSAENALMDAFSQASNGSTHAILLNFSGLDYMNSSGIGLLVTLLIRTQRQKQKLMACGLSEHYEEIFKLTRLNEAIGIYADESDALAALL